MSTVNQDELKAIKVLKFTGKETEWDHWSEKFVALARASIFAGILLGTENAPRADKDIDRKKEDHRYELTEAERKEKKIVRKVCCFGQSKHFCRDTLGYRECTQSRQRY